jgi:hypothetical protein
VLRASDDDYNNSETMTRIQLTFSLSRNTIASVWSYPLLWLWDICIFPVRVHLWLLSSLVKTPGRQSATGCLAPSGLNVYFCTRGEPRDCQHSILIDYVPQPVRSLQCRSGFHQLPPTMQTPPRLRGRSTLPTFDGSRRCLVWLHKVYILRVRFVG